MTVLTSQAKQNPRLRGEVGGNPLGGVPNEVAQCILDEVEAHARAHGTSQEDRNVCGRLPVSDCTVVVYRVGQL